MPRHCSSTGGAPALHGQPLVLAPAAGQLQEKEHLLNEKDGLWLALRHRHFADACAEIASRMDEFRSKNAAARRTGNEDALDVRNMRRLVQALPQYRWTSPQDRARSHALDADVHAPVWQAAGQAAPGDKRISERASSCCPLGRGPLHDTACILSLAFSSHSRSLSAGRSPNRG
jgi:Sec1 family